MYGLVDVRRWLGNFWNCAVLLFRTIPQMTSSAVTSADCFAVALIKKEAFAHQANFSRAPARLIDVTGR